MYRQLLRSLAGFTLALLLVPAVHAANPDRNPLEGFTWLIGKEWKSGNTIQTFDWGIDRLTVKSKSYRKNGTEKTLVAEGHWFWHPEEKKIRGFFTATGMPFYMIESEAEIRGKSIIHSLKTYSKGAGAQYWVEVFESKSSSYEWKLFMGKSATGNPVMTDTFAAG